jgi:hypothetical protein
MNSLRRLHAPLSWSSSVIMSRRFVDELVRPLPLVFACTSRLEELGRPLGIASWRKSSKVSMNAGDCSMRYHVNRRRT